MAQSDEGDDDFAVIYSRLVNVFRQQVSFTMVFPLALRLFKQVPPETVEVYSQLGHWYSYKRDEAGENWLEEGMRLLGEATEEQYRIRETETEIEVTRRETTMMRQEIADEAMKRYSRVGHHVDEPVEMLEQRIERAKETVIREESEKWEEAARRRIRAEEEQTERLRLARDRYREGQSGRSKDIGNSYLGIVLGGTAIAVGIIAIMKGYHYV